MIQTLHSSVRCNLALDDRWIYEVLHMTPFSAKLLWGLIQTVWITTPGNMFYMLSHMRLVISSVNCVFHLLMLYMMGSINKV